MKSGNKKSRVKLTQLFGRSKPLPYDVRFSQTQSVGVDALINPKHRPVRCAVRQEQAPALRRAVFANAFVGVDAIIDPHGYYILSTVSIPNNASALFITPHDAAARASLAFFTSSGTSAFNIGFEL